MLQIPIPQNENPQALFEFNIRGRFISLACDIEFMLQAIIVNCADNPNQQKRNFYKVELHEKIQNAICDLKKYPNLYAKYAADLEVLWDFKKIRNSMAHNALLWDKANEHAFKIMTIDENEHLEFTQFTIFSCYRSIFYFNNFAIKLAAILKELQELRGSQNWIEPTYG